VQANRYRAAAEFRAELRRFLRRSETKARAAGVTPSQHLLLLQIAGAEDGVTTVSSLVASLSLTQSAVTELVQRAEQAGLVTRRPSTTDARVVLLSLTPEGEARLARIHDSLGAERAELRHVIDALGD
jgi:DNA-binding MarR family transcriptional regulator